MSTMSDLASMRRQLLEHFDAHRREPPWRESRDPYRVWISEIMLQQTRVETAAPYYLRWMERFPSVSWRTRIRKPCSRPGKAWDTTPELVTFIAPRSP